MQRHKLLALVVGALAALGGASVMFLGNAQAATWHDYKGDLYAGHAYGLQVPAKAEAYEITLEGEPGATATFTLLDPEGASLGHHVLTWESPSLLVDEPAQGRHALYVYDLQGGALKLRVDAILAPLSVGLQKLPLHKADLVLAEQAEAAPLDLAVEKDLGATPVFLTLLYEGSVTDLDATIASAKGDVVTIRDESGTAFAPGVWSHLKGARASDPANLEGAVFTIAAKAERFEGALTLTTLSVDQKVPAETETTTAAPAPAPLPVNGAFTAPVGTPIAFTASKGALRITDVEDVVEREGDDEERDHGHWTGAIAIYDPEDALLAYVELDDRSPNATVKLPADGEYVAYVHDARADGFLLQLVGESTLSGIRELAVATEEFEFDVSSGLLLGSDEGEAFTLLHAPVAMEATLDEGADAVLSSVYVENANGVVVTTSTFLQAPGVRDWGGSFQQPENFAAGEHAVHAQGITEGTLTLVSTYYVRQDAPAVEAVAPVAPEPAAPAEPPAPPVEGIVGDLLGLLGF